MTAAALRDVNIVAVVRALGGPEPRSGRLRAWWRDGDGLNVAIDPTKGQWYDHARGEGGGVLSLVRSVMLVDDAGALAWLTGNGFLEDRPRETKGRRDEDRGPVIARYNYVAESGEVVYEVRRHEPKAFSQAVWTGSGWKTGRGCMDGVRRLLYRLPEVIGAPIVFIVEGEKDVDTLADHGFVATCNSGGAGKWNHDNDSLFVGKEVIILPDADEPGMKHARDVAAGLLPHAARLSVLILEGAKDASEWFGQGHGELELIELIERGAHAAK